MKVDLITREYPPFVYGGAGVHVEELSKVLRHLLGDGNLTVRCFDGARNSEGDDTQELVDDYKDVYGYDAPAGLKSANATLSTLGVDLQIANDCKDADLVHSHTWYANAAGFLASKLYNIPHVITAHSLEPLRPWKKEQLGGGYEISSWVEKTAYENAAGIIAVSDGMRQDILKAYPNVDPSKVHVVLNGIDLNSFKLSDESSDVLERYNINKDAPTAIFVGRITRQKGLTYFLDAAAQIRKDVQIILCAGAPDTPEIAKEVSDKVNELNKSRGNIIWIEEMLPKFELTKMLDFSDVFICPSVYEPLGIVNLEAMALSLPVVATRTGGIPEVVVDGETGILVDIEQVQDGTGTPTNPAKFALDYANAVNRMFSDLNTAAEMGKAGYIRARDHFSWQSIGEDVVKFYERAISQWKEGSKQ